MVKKYLIGFMVLVVLSASVYILLPNQMRIDVEKTKTSFQVYEEGKWVLSGIERTVLYDGTTKMRAKNRTIEYFLGGNKTIITRITHFKEGIIAIDTYLFDGGTKNVELYPVEHNVRILNGNGKIFHYEVNDLEYFGETKKDIPSPQSFGHRMKVEWSSGNYYSKIFKYKDKDVGKLIVRYKIDSNDFNKNVRLFDPWWNESWENKKEIKVQENSGKVLINYAIALNVSYESSMQSDFQDLRFINGTENTELDYWIDSFESSNWAYVWVEIPYIPLNNNETIYMYYGNSNAGGTSNRSNTFWFFDDFSTNKINISYQCTISSVGQNCNYNSTTKRMDLISNPSDSTILWQNSTTYDDVEVRFITYDYDASGNDWIGINYAPVITSAGGYSIGLVRAYSGDNSLLSQATGSTPIGNNAEIIFLWANSSSTNTTGNLTVGGIWQGEKYTITINDTGYIGIHARDGDFSIDNLQIRNLTLPEPTPFFGAEQSDGIIPYFVFPTKANASIIFSKEIKINISVNKSTAEVITIYLYNSTRNLLNTSIGSGTFHYVLFNVSYNDTYIYNSTANNSEGDINTTEERFLILDYPKDFNITLAGNITFEFDPSNTTHKAIAPTGQTSSLGTFLAENNLTINGSIYAKLDETISGITFKMGNSNNYSNATSINTTYLQIDDEFNVSDVNYLWSWADYNSYGGDWFPELEIVVRSV